MKDPESEFNEFEPHLKSAKNWIQLSAGLNLETLYTISVEPTIFEPLLKFKSGFKFFKYGLRLFLGQDQSQNLLESQIQSARPAFS